eukprot:RCo018597
MYRVLAVASLSTWRAAILVQRCSPLCGGARRSGSSSSAAPAAGGLMDLNELGSLRNIGISAHIDSGKTTLTERILYYTGKIEKMHEVKGSDEVGATMDFMELEREKGITIQSASTFAEWKGLHFNIIDTPGHIDFTIEVERSLKVMDGAIMIVCGVAGVQSQTITVDRQMNRYKVPRVVFINKLDRMGVIPYQIIGQLREQLKLNAALIQLPIGLEENHEGVVDIIEGKAYLFRGTGRNVEVEEIPEDMKADAVKYREFLVESLIDHDQELGDAYLEGTPITAEMLKAAIRRCTIRRTFVPVTCGSAYKNKGVQPLLDAVVAYLPDPRQRQNYAYDLSKVPHGVQDYPEEALVPLVVDPKAPFVGLAFKITETKFGQLTWMRVYQGSLKKGATIINLSQSKSKHRVPRLARLHADQLENIDEIGPGEICAVFGVPCSSGDAFSDKEGNLAMSKMHVPDPVVSVGVTVKDTETMEALIKVLGRYSREDPTFKFLVEPESGRLEMSGMGELHLEIFKERLRREEGIDITVGRPYVNYREAVTQSARFDYFHKKQTGGSGQYAKIQGFLEPLPLTHPTKFEFVSVVPGGNISATFVTSVRKGFEECMAKGPLLGNPVWGVKFVLEDGAMHAVDSSDVAFKIAARLGFDQAFAKAGPTLLQPIMKVEIGVPTQSFGSVLGALQSKGANILSQRTLPQTSSLIAEVPLAEMFGYNSDLRQLTSGRGEFTMEYARHDPMEPHKVPVVQEEFRQAHSGGSGGGKPGAAPAGKKKK